MNAVLGLFPNKYTEINDFDIFHPFTVHWVKRMAHQQALLQQLLDLHSNAAVVNYCCVAAYTWFAYDYAVTFRNEVDLVWMKPWGAGKLLFLVMRYFGVVLLTVNILVTMTSNHSAKVHCQGYFFWEGSGGSCMLYIVETILQLRIFAMYDRNKYLTVFNGILFLIEIVVMLTVYNIGIKSGITLPTPEGLTGCFGITTSYLFSIWIPALVFEFWLVLLALWKAVHRARQGVAVNGRKLDLFAVLIRDSVIYFILIGVGLFTNTMLWLAGPDGLAPAAVSLSHASMFIGGSRLLLNLRQAFYSEDQTNVNSSIGFKPTPNVGGYQTQTMSGWQVDTAMLIDPMLDDVRVSGGETLVMDDIDNRTQKGPIYSHPASGDIYDIGVPRAI